MSIELFAEGLKIDNREEIIVNVDFRLAKIFIFIIRPFGEKLVAVSEASSSATDGIFRRGSLLPMGAGGISSKKYL